MRMPLLLASMFLCGCGSNITQWTPEMYPTPTDNAWSGITFVPDESVPGEKSSAMRAVIQEVKKNHPDGDTVEHVNIVRKLKDGSLVSVGIMLEFMPGGWAGHFSSTGALIKNFASGGRFLGSVEKYVFIGNSFGDGGGAMQQINAIDVDTGKQTLVYSMESYFDGKESSDPSIVPKDCARTSVDDERIAPKLGDITLFLKRKGTELAVGTVCAFPNGDVIIPFAFPEYDEIGIATAYDGKDFWYETSKVEGPAFPPTYSKAKDYRGVQRSVLFESGGLMLWNQDSYEVFEDGSIHRDMYYREKSNVRFCMENGCPENIRPYAVDGDFMSYGELVELLEKQ